MDNKELDKKLTSVFTQFNFVVKNKEAMEKSAQDQAMDEILTEEEQIISKDIMLEFKKKIDDFDFFLNKQYMIFNYKIHRCTYNRCYDNVFKSRPEIRECIQECNEGTAAAETYVKGSIEKFNEEFDVCLEKAQQNTKNIMNETFLCYNSLITGFERLKKMIKTEFKFYE